MPQIAITNILDLEYVITEDDPFTSREQIVCAPNAVVWNAGTVLGKALFGTPTAAAKAGGNTGNGTISAVTNQGTGETAGIYTVRFTSPTTFNVEKPNGDMIGQGSTGTAFSDDVGFTITAGGTAFVAGDGFDITVAAGSGQYAPVDPTQTNGLERPAGILMFSLPVSATVTRTGAHVRKCGVNGNKLFYVNAVTGAQKALIEAEFASRNLFVRY
jgi:hypothetical protein